MQNLNICRNERFCFTFIFVVQVSTLTYTCTAAHNDLYRGSEGSYLGDITEEVKGQLPQQRNPVVF